MILLHSLLVLIWSFAIDGAPSYPEQCSAPQLLAEKDGVSVYVVDDFFTAEECDALLDSRRKGVVARNMAAPLVCFGALSTFLWYMHPREFEGRFIEGTMCANATTSAQLLTPNPPNGRPIDYSTSLSLYPGETPFADLFEERMHAVATALGRIAPLFSAWRGGKYQMTQYALGQGYAPHTDCTLGGSDRRDRAGTALVYLEDTDDGGETVFPELLVGSNEGGSGGGGDGARGALSVVPKRGRALFFNSMDPETGACLPRSRHEARPVGTAAADSARAAGASAKPVPDVRATPRGRERASRPGAPAAAAGAAAARSSSAAPASKTILQRWYYYEAPPSLGRRAPEPSLPPRSKNTAYVACDGVGGYCRWYDEWPYNHLVEYRRQFGMMNGVPSESSFVWRK